MAEITRALSVVWAVPPSVTNSLSCSLNVYNNVGIAGGFRFKIYKFVDNENAFGYAIRKPIPNSLSVPFKIEEAVKMTLNFSFKIDTPIKIKVKQIGFPFKISKVVHTRLIIPWEVLPISSIPGVEFDRRYVVPPQERQYKYLG